MMFIVHAANLERHVLEHTCTHSHAHTEEAMHLAVLAFERAVSLLCLVSCWCLQTVFRDHSVSLCCHWATQLSKLVNKSRIMEPMF